MNNCLATFAGGFALLASLSAPASAGPITLTFDEFSDQTPIRNQYQAMGVTVSGTNAILAFFTPWPANTGIYFGYAPNGVMTFSLDTAITGPIKNVSLYASAIRPINIFAYDAAGLLVGQAVSQTMADNESLTITSSGNPIVSVSIQGLPSDFAIDTLTFAPATTIPFSNFAPALAAAIGSKPNTDSFVLGTPLTLSAGASRFNPAADVVTLKVGTLVATFPVNSFKSNGRGGFYYLGKLANGAFSATIQPSGTTKYTMLIAGTNVSLAGLSNPVPVSLTIGENTGDRTVTAIIKRLPSR